MLLFNLLLARVWSPSTPEKEYLVLKLLNVSLHSLCLSVAWWWAGSDSFHTLHSHLIHWSYKNINVALKNPSGENQVFNFVKNIKIYIRNFSKYHMSCLSVLVSYYRYYMELKHWLLVEQYLTPAQSMLSFLLYSMTQSWERQLEVNCPLHHCRVGTGSWSRACVILEKFVHQRKWVMSLFQPVMAAGPLFSQCFHHSPQLTGVSASAAQERGFRGGGQRPRPELTYPAFVGTLLGMLMTA